MFILHKKVYLIDLNQSIQKDPATISKKKPQEVPFNLATFKEVKLKPPK